LFQSVLAGPASPEPVLRFLSPAVGAMLALSAGLAAACFVRAYGMAFLGRPRSNEAATAGEAPLPQQAGMAVLTALCILGGLFGSFAAGALSSLLVKLVGASLPSPSAGPTPFSLIAFNPARRPSSRRHSPARTCLPSLRARWVIGPAAGSDVH
jgi:formate hydrogenlyase subunit 3/multisubunit Na+/H+ antiporter MnhD subunit